MEFNPNALVFWVFAGLIGFILGGAHGVLIAVTIAFVISLLASLI